MYTHTCAYTQANQPIIKAREVASLYLISNELLEQTKRLVKELHQEHLKLPRDTVLHQQFIDAVHGNGTKTTKISRPILATVTAKTGIEKNHIQDGWCDEGGERNPAEEMTEALEGSFADGDIGG